MGHYDSARDAEHERWEAAKRQELLIDILSGRYDCLLEAASLTNTPVSIPLEAFNRMLAILKDAGRADATVAEVAGRRNSERARYLIERLHRESQGG